MTLKLKRLMYISAMIDMVPWLLFSFTGVYTRLYLARNVDVEFFALCGIVDTLASCIVLQYISNEQVIKFIKSNVVYISVFGSSIDILRAFLLPYYPSCSLLLGTLTGVLVANVVSYGFKELVNAIYIHTDRTVYSVVVEKYGQIAALAAMVLAYFLKDLDINIIVTVLIVANCLVVVGDFAQYKLFTTYKA